MVNPIQAEHAGPEGLAAIVLAAGGATRFGGPKQLAVVGGEALVRRAARRALGCCPAGVVVVTGAWGDDVGAALAGLAVRLARNECWASGGLASSLRCGLDAIPEGASASLILLCDQPDIDEDDLRRLAAAWAAAPQRVAAAGYGGVAGVPAIFPGIYWDRLRALSGDRGAGALIAGLSEVTIVALPHAARDIDTPDDLKGTPRG
jgi:molybdenum cofactor cytidylyltransferase